MAVLYCKNNKRIEFVFAAKQQFFCKIAKLYFLQSLDSSKENCKLLWEFTILYPRFVRNFEIITLNLSLSSRLVAFRQTLVIDCFKYSVMVSPMVSLLFTVHSLQTNWNCSCSLIGLATMTIQVKYINSRRPNYFHDTK